MQAETGTFHSPGYPGRYPPHAVCMWLIQTPVGSRVQLQVKCSHPYSGAVLLVVCCNCLVVYTL